MSDTITHVMINRNALEKWRKKAGIRKATIARALGVCPRTITRYIHQSRMPWAHFKLLQIIMRDSGGDPNSIIDKAVYLDGRQPSQMALTVPE